MKSLILVLLLTVSAWAQNPNTPALMGGLWMQTSAEYRALCLQAYNAGRAYLTVSQVKGAVVMDLDETVLDNGPYQSYLYLTAQPYSEESWSAWIEYQAREPRAQRAVPGAIEFIQFAEANGFTVVYISNRPESGRAATVELLGALGVSRPEPSRLLLREAGSPSSKEARREKVLAQHAVLAYFGDDLNDFMDFEKGVEGRYKAVQSNEVGWGADWFILPNPVYGSWQPGQALPASSQELLPYIDDAGFREAIAPETREIR